MSRGEHFPLPKTIGIVTSPQHVMNLSQAFLSGKVQTPLLVYVLVPARERKSHVESLTVGTVNFFTQIFHETEFIFVSLKRYTWELQVAALVRKTWSKKNRCSELYLGLKPSGLWARSFPAVHGERITLLDDGAETLSTDFSNLLNGEPSTSHGKIYDIVCRTIAGRSSNTSKKPHLYTCFPTNNDNGTIVEKHDYSELLAELSTLTIEDQVIDQGTVFIDSNFRAIGDSLHSEVLTEIHSQIGFKYYVPHRRTSREFIRKVANSLSVTPIRPPVPIEIYVSSWLLKGNRVLITPSSLSRTGPLFGVGSRNLYSVNFLPWLQHHVASGQKTLGADQAIIAMRDEEALINDCVLDSPDTISLEFVTSTSQ